MTFFESVKALGVKFDTHESDLYVPVTAATKALVADYQFRENVTTFRGHDGALWFDVPFANDRYWARQAKGFAQLPNVCCVGCTH